MKTTVKALLVLFSAWEIINLHACKGKDNNPSPIPPSTPKGVLMFHLHTYIDNNEVDALKIVYTTDAGRKMSLSTAQFYVSGIEVIKADGSVYQVAGKKILKTFDTETFAVGDIPVGDYKSVRFHIGLDSATNLQDAATSPDKELLNKPEMWFGAGSQPEGYIFLNAQGTIDTSINMNGPQVPFVYKMGTNTSYKLISMPEKPFTILEDQAEYIHIVADYSMLFNGIDIRREANLHIENKADNAAANAIIVAGNIPSMFRYE